MTKNEFLHRFQLSNLSASSQTYRHTGGLKSAAVLIPIVEVLLPNQSKQLNVLLTTRATHLKHHPGQVSFPGGKAETFDKNLIETALRETQEEIGLPATTIEVIGQLHPYHTISGYVVTPIIAFVASTDEVLIDENEVSAVFQVPLQHFLDQKNHHTVKIMQQNALHSVHFMPYQAFNIWGATATMLKDLTAHLR